MDVRKPSYFALKGLRLRKYTQLRENWAAENFSGPSANIPKFRNLCWKNLLKGLQWPLCLPEAWYNKGCIYRLANPHKGCTSVVVCMSVYLPVCLPCRFVRNYTCSLCQIFGACCLRLWLDFPPAKGSKSAIYDCLVAICYSSLIMYCCMSHSIYLSATNEVAQTSKQPYFLPVLTNTHWWKNH